MPVAEAKRTKGTEPDWWDWSNPDYDRLFEMRQTRLAEIRNTPGMLDGLLEFYKDHPVEFIGDWGMTFDPRNAEVGLPTVIPFVLFARQAEFIEWVINDLWREREDGLAEKSRDMGVSWLCVAIAIWMWRFHPGTVIGFGSRKEEYVDKIGDPKSLFWKARQFINLLPVEFRPKKYVEDKHAPHMRILNPDNGAAIVGEAGDNIGRGNRTSVYFKDESAFYEHAEAIDAALSQTSNCKVDVSTPNGSGNPFYKKRHSRRTNIFSFHWRQDPRKNEEWYEKQKEKLDRVVLAQEIEIDYHASTTDSWVSGDLIAAAQGIGPANVVPIGGWIIGVDAAHFGDDESVIHCRRGRLNLKQVIRSKLDGPQLAWLTEAQADLLEKTSQPVVAIVIELDGPGTSAYDQLRMGRYADRTIGLHTGARVDDGANYNVRAMLHRKAKEYLEDTPCCLHNDAEIRTQGGAIKYSYRSGLLLMQSKKEYKKLNGCSPDRWDAFVLTFGADSATGPLSTGGQAQGHEAADDSGY